MDKYRVYMMLAKVFGNDKIGCIRIVRAIEPEIGLREAKRTFEAAQALLAKDTDLQNLHHSLRCLIGRILDSSTSAADTGPLYKALDRLLEFEQGQLAAELQRACEQPQDTQASS